MNKNFIKATLVGLLVLVTDAASSQTAPKTVSEFSTYQLTPAKINDLIHTKLEVSFDYNKRYLFGKEWLTVKPHFYETNQLILDAKGMDIKELGIVQGNIITPLKYSYDKEQLIITLNKNYNRTEQYTVYIDYVSKPDELKAKGSKAISDAKGLYFINPDGKANKPVQIWTQGETEASSVWFPTIDKPNQKTTSEIAITVEDKYTTLSNGILSSQTKNSNGTRTDIWKMNQPNAPYLFMMAVGDFKIYKDSYNGKEVSYYLEPTYAPFAKELFGKTPDMMNFYSKLLGVEYPWDKYAQIVGRDYVAGAMENTSATLHGEHVQKTPRELLDSNEESTIAHELFHQWFGDYVTAESWSNLTMNESFATFGEVLWHGHDAGQDAEDRSRYEKLQNYFRSSKNGTSPTLARFHYHDKEDMFDNISYSKGSIILYALKNQMGDEAFFKSLQKYLEDNAFKSGESHQLRLAMEEITGKDWSPYFNQWYYQGGNPILDVTYGFENGKATIGVKQIQDPSSQIYSLPLKVDFYLKGSKITKDLLIDQKEQNFIFELPSKPLFTDLDPDKILVGEVRDNKSINDIVFQYKNAPTYYNRIEAVKFASKNNSDDAQNLLVSAAKDIQDDIRILSIKALDLNNKTTKKKALKVLLDLAKSDKVTAVRANAVIKLSSTIDKTYKVLAQNALNDQSYNVIAGGILGLKNYDEKESAEAFQALDLETQKFVTSSIKKLTRK